MSDKLYEDALKLSVNEELRNVRTLLDWAEEARELKEKIQHTEQAHRLLTEVAKNLRELNQI
ncbi:MAG: hypothetical protein ACPGQL_01920 [Thermoplasmatota archaeon]